MLRFLQRAGGLDVEGVRGHLAASLARAQAAADQVGARSYTIMADGLIYVVEDGVVVTCYPLRRDRGYR
ncbi:MAG: hypothetical protein HC900_13045 [Methylacidiphilales bacterium]|nr:hypothetical protein [Candidatus Methylacidiphilales bacterium]